jgi:glycosyltransferase involved in cell wall biosynthesis
VRIGRRRGRLDPLPFAGLSRLIIAARPDVVHVWHWLPAAAAAPVCRLFGVPLVDGTVRSGRPARDFRLARRSVRSLANIVVANSHAGLQAWRVAATEGRVVYNAFDPARLEALQGLPRPEAHRPGDDGRPFTVVMTGRLHVDKDHGSLLAAARLLASHSAPPAWRFVLVGDGPKRQEVEAEAADLIARGVVEFASPGLEVLPLVAAADVGVLMTNDAAHAEGCSNSIMEYMASGLPVVCCDSGGNKELVTDGVNGYVIPPGDVAALAHRLELLRADPERRGRMGAAGEARLRCDFSLARMVDAYVSIYDDCVRSMHDCSAKTP